MDVGERLKTIRKLKGLSQRELAKRAGVTNSTISMIEKNGVSPSVSSLKKVLSGFPVAIGDFFAADFESLAPAQVVFRANEQPDVGENDICAKLVGAPLSQRTMSIRRENYPPGADSGLAQLKRGAECGGLVISGEIELTVGIDVYQLAAGDGFYLNSAHPYRLKNIGSEPCEIINAGSSL